MKIFSTFIIVWSACSLMFLTQFIIVLIDYYEGKTGIGRSHIESGAPKMLPCLTFCPMPAFKMTNFPPLTLETNMESFLNLTYGREDIFNDTTFHISDEWAVKELRIGMLGRCTVTCNKKLREARDFMTDNLAYKLNPRLNYQVTVHLPGDEFWMLSSLYPYTMITFVLESNSINKFKSADLHIEEIETVSAQKASKPCDPYISHEDLVNCIKKNWAIQISSHPNITCKLTMSEFDVIQQSTKLCAEKDDVDRVLKLGVKYFEQVVSDPRSVGCSLPCRTKRFRIHVNYFPRVGNVHAPIENSYFELYPFYTTLSTTVETEYFIQDLSTMLTSIGGNLGLFLGYSAMSLLMTIMDTFKLWFQRYMSSRK